MADIEKVIKGLESCIGHCALKECPYFDEKCETVGCNGNQVMKDALELLKEQETLEMRLQHVLGSNGRTGVSWYKVR